ncbi:RNase E specificity factor CsrD [Budvicia diplopodorum]|uniref:RNase E specificity factor CsrD n=1 Tax=Budvicia diplopodorum TaxID=1119056 RepID=UPI0013590FEE|nr:RNase E specificity factor CsrD [Budvicia diplopodorum]
MRLTARLSIFISLLVFLTMIIVLITSMLSIYFVGENRMEKHWRALASTVDQALSHQSSEYYNDWLPALIYATDVRHLTISDAQNNVIYTHSSERRTGFWDRFHSLSEADLELPLHPNYDLKIVYASPILSTIFSIPTLLSILTTAVFISLILFLWIRWLKQQFNGLLLLEERSWRILAGEREEVAAGNIHEWPVNTSGAIDRLLSDLKNLSEERLRVDKLIRAFAAQDSQTGLNNRLFFDNQLATQLEENNVHGVVMMIRLPELELLTEAHGKEVVDDLLYMLVNMLSTFIMRHPAALLARYFSNDFSVMLPHRSLKEADAIASQLVNAVGTLPILPSIKRDSLIHIGICAYHSGQLPDQIMDNAEQAARTAELQGGNGWSIYDSPVQNVVRGSVRWRTLLEQVLSRGGPDIYYKPAVNINGKLNHREILVRIHDEKDELQPAEFMPLVQQFGLTERFDRQVIGKSLPLLDLWPNDSIAVSITVDSLLKHSFQIWLRDNLLERTKEQRKRIIFELAEADVCQYSDRLRPVARLLTAVGCRLGIMQAGLTVVSTSYIKIMPIEVIKLHPGLVRNIDRRSENQLFVDSLVSACEGTNIAVMAASVRTHLEWETLRSRGVVGGQGDFFGSPIRIPTS